MQARRRPSAERQVELVDAALHIIATAGIAALGTRSVAEHVGLSTGAMFRHFPTLDALLDAVVARVEAVIEATYPPPGLAPLARLVHFVEARTRAVGEQRGVLRLVISEQFQLALPASGSARIAACIATSRAFVVACLRDAQATGEIRTDLEPEALAPIVMGTMQGLALARGRQREAEAQRIRDALFTLLRPPPVTRTRTAS